MKKVRPEKLTLKGLDFVHIASDGVETVVFKAADEEVANSISRMLSFVNGGGLEVGYRAGHKNGLLTGGVIGATAGLAFAYALAKLIMAMSKKENEEADAE